MKTFAVVLLLLLPSIAFGQMDARDIWMNAQRSAASRTMTPEEQKAKEARDAAREASAITPDKTDCRLRSWGQATYQAAPSKAPRAAKGQSHHVAKPQLTKRELMGRLTKIYADGEVTITDANGNETNLTKGKLSKLDLAYVERIETLTKAKKETKPEKQTGDIPPAFNNKETR